MSSINLKKLKLTVYGKSHADYIGFRLDGIPAGFTINFDEINAFCRRRTPSDAVYSTKRREDDRPTFISGIKDGKTTGETIEAIIENRDAVSSDYETVKDVPRPSHADYVAYVKYGKDRDYRGGGEFSGRMTAPLCVAGAICLQYLQKYGVKIISHVSSAGKIKDKPFDLSDPLSSGTILSDFPVLSESAKKQMLEEIKNASDRGDSVGGTIETAVIGLKAGIGGPGFDSLEGKLSEMIFGVPAVRAIEFGNGTGISEMRGSEANDPFEVSNGKIITKTNNSGGINGGISNGMPIVFKVFMRPTPSISVEQDSISLSERVNKKLKLTGRHDPCLTVRALPAIESAAAVAVLDSLLDNENTDCSSLGDIRREIDSVDDDLCELFAKRMSLSKKIAAIKKANHLETTDSSREKEITDRISALLGEDLSPYGKELWAKIMELSKKYQISLNNDDPEP